jgi:glycerol-3-phosphate dehydrogenase
MKDSILKQRNLALTQLSETPLDLLVIGGGIVGAGIARDASMRGLKTALVEQHDFAFGTSSRSTRLLHGGIRYLAQGRIGLVREASIEKGVLQRIAPHLAKPLAFVFPIYPGADWPLWQMRLGVKFYDLLCGGRNLGKSSSLSKEQCLQTVPHLRREDLSGAVRYFDGFTNDARLVIDTLRSASAHGAKLLNYVKFEGAHRDRDVWHCGVKDQLTARSFVCQARAVVNATGPWAPGVPHGKIQLRLTKGVHLVVDLARLPMTDAVVLTAGKRILFAIPWGKCVILGTTDTDYSGSLDDVQPSPEDVSYVLKTVNEFFPAARITGSDIISSWAGLRPLIANSNGSASDISRAHQIRSPEPGWWDVAGGKLTTYRLIAEQTVDRIAAAQKWRLPKCLTAAEPLLRQEETDLVSGILPPVFDRNTMAHCCTREWALHLDDVMTRRTSWRYYYPDASEKAVQVAHWMGEFLGWSKAGVESELRRYRGAPGPTPSPNRRSPGVIVREVAPTQASGRQGHTGGVQISF